VEEDYAGFGGGCGGPCFGEELVAVGSGERAFDCGEVGHGVVVGKECKMVYKVWMVIASGDEASKSIPSSCEASACLTSKH